MSLLRKLSLLVVDLQKMLTNKMGSPQQRAKKTFRAYDITPVVGSFASSSEMMHPDIMQVVRVIRETADTVSLVMSRQDKHTIQFVPGMFYTVIATIDGVEYRRAYSISSASTEAHTVTITIKRVQDGLVSNWINDHVLEGTLLRVFGPSGTFVLLPDSTQKRHILLIGGGSGITPLMSICKSVLAIESESTIHLLYGNRSKEEAIFFDEFKRLQKQYSDRLTIRHVLETPAAGWKGGKGRLDRSTFAQELDHLATLNINDSAVYMCGPEPMMEGVRAELLSRGMLAKHIHQERFTPAPTHKNALSYAPQALIIHVNGKTWKGQSKPSETLLESGLALSADMQFSCTMGGCGRCRIKILQGDVEMDEPNCLTAEEHTARYALSCITRPLSAVEFEIAPPNVTL